MKYVKIFGLLVLAAAAPMAFAGPASADTATSPTNTTYTGEIVAESEGHAILHNPIAKIECASVVKGNISGHGKGTAVSGLISSITFTSCTNEWHVTTIAPGSFAVDDQGASTTLTSNAWTLEATRFGINCRYATSNTKIGTFTDSANDKVEATIDLVASVPFHGGSFLCGSGATTLTGSYKVTTPIPLVIDNN